MPVGRGETPLSWGSFEIKISNKIELLGLYSKQFSSKNYSLKEIVCIMASTH